MLNPSKLIHQCTGSPGNWVMPFYPCLPYTSHPVQLSLLSPCSQCTLSLLSPCSQCTTHTALPAGFTHLHLQVTKHSVLHLSKCQCVVFHHQKYFRSHEINFSFWLTVKYEILRMYIIIPKLDTKK
jgi:hypothetical protein